MSGLVRLQEICTTLNCHVTQCQGGIEKKEYYRDEMQCGSILFPLTESLPTLQKLIWTDPELAADFANENNDDDHSLITTCR